MHEASKTLTRRPLNVSGVSVAGRAADKRVLVLLFAPRPPRPRLQRRIVNQRRQMKPKSELILHQTGTTGCIEVRLENETVWLSLNQLGRVLV
jgi:hypothetical protein